MSKFSFLKGAGGKLILMMIFFNALFFAGGYFLFYYFYVSIFMLAVYFLSFIILLFFVSSFWWKYIFSVPFQEAQGSFQRYRIGEKESQIYLPKNPSHELYPLVQEANLILGQYENIISSQYEEMCQASERESFQDKHLKEIVHSIEDLEKTHELTTQHAREVLEFLPVPLVIISHEGIVLFCNKAWVELLKYPLEKETLYQTNFLDLFLSTSRSHFQFMIEKAIMEHDLLSYYYTASFKDKGKRALFVQMNLCEYEHENQITHAVLCTMTNTHKMRKLEDRLKLLEITDSVTGLYTKRHFITLCNYEVKRFLRYKHPLTIMVIDCNNLAIPKESDTPANREKVLRTIAQTCKKIIRVTDIFGRTDQQQIAIALTETSIQNALSAANRLSETVRLIPFKFNDTGVKPYRAQFKIGLATPTYKEKTIYPAMARAYSSIIKLYSESDST